MSTVRLVGIWALPLLLAISLHEVAHGGTARHFGDPIADRAGRLSLNPFKHVDPIGTLLVPVVLLLLPGNFVFGWAKPVPVNQYPLDNPKRHMALVAAAGPMANLAMALAWASLARIGLSLTGELAALAQMLVSIAAAGILINLILMIVNLLPLPPLDGSRVLAGLVPARAAGYLMRVEPFGLVIILGLLATGLLGQTIWPPLVASLSFLDRFLAIGPIFAQTFAQ